MQPTSLKAYNEVKDSLTAQQSQILAFLGDCADASDREISEATGILTSLVPARRGELLGRKLVEQGEKRRCRVTGRVVMVWKRITFEAKEKPKQSAMFKPAFQYE